MREREKLLRGGAAATSERERERERERKRGQRRRQSPHCARPRGERELLLQTGREIEQHRQLHSLVHAPGRAVEDVPPTAVVGLHRARRPVPIVAPPGPLLAGCGFFKAQICGGRAGADPVLAASSTIFSLQNLVSREADPLDSQVVSVAMVNGSFSGGGEFVLGGTFRAFSNASFYTLRRRIEEVMTLQPRVHGCEATVDFFENQSFYPPTVNDPRMYAHVRATARALLGDGGYRDVPPMMGAEDFSFYSQAVPAGFYYVGVRNETLGSVHTGHSPYFMIDEDVLPTGAAVHAAIAERYLAEQDGDPRSPEQEL